MSRRDPLARPGPLIARVYAFVAYRVGDGPDAEDITSTTFERALRRRTTYDPARGAPISWLLGIARHCISDHFAGREIPVAQVPERADPADRIDHALTRISLAHALSQLDLHDQELLALRYGADLTARRIAEVLGMSTNAVEVALTRARQRLRDLIGEDPRKDIFGERE